MLLAMPSPDCWKSLKLRTPRIIMSRMMSRDQRSPTISSDLLTGQPERCFSFELPGTQKTLARLTCKVQVSLGRIRQNAGRAAKDEGRDGVGPAQPAA